VCVCGGGTDQSLENCFAVRIRLGDISGGNTTQNEKHSRSPEYKNNYVFLTEVNSVVMVPQRMLLYNYITLTLVMFL
jgi:hypothetical protein